MDYSDFHVPIISFSYFNMKISKLQFTFYTFIISLNVGEMKEFFTRIETTLGGTSKWKRAYLFPFVKKA